MTYAEYKEKVSDDINNFPMMFAFTEEQFSEGMNKLGVSSVSELCSIGCNGFIRKANKESYISLGQAHKQLFAECLKDEQFCYSMFLKEMHETEYIISNDDEEVLEACHLSAEEYQDNDMLKEMFQKAKKKYYSLF